ncbi:hypothetical protein LJK88_05130 [Paenibacillus sp. P26]|nr:hypothetical protein LJK88_05130 [Paenibacillus sp. P26]
MFAACSERYRLPARGPGHGADRPGLQAARQDFTADASHELRTPLSVLQSSIEILSEEQEAFAAVSP